VRAPHPLAVQSTTGHSRAVAALQWCGASACGVDHLLHLSAAVWELFTGTLAFKNLHYGAVVQRVVVAGQRPPIPEVAPEEYCLLMTR
jgi:hypothetical protein